MASTSALYGVIGALAVVVVGGGIYLATKDDTRPMTAAVMAPMPAPAPAPTPPAVATPQPAPPPPARPAGPTAVQAEQLRDLLLDARRAITRGDFNSADRALDQAERIDPRSSDVIAARRDLRDAQRRANRTGGGVDRLVAEARAAITRHEYATADRLLDQAESIDARDHDVQQARAELSAAQRPAPGPGRR